MHFQNNLTKIEVYKSQTLVDLVPISRRRP